MTQTKRVTEFLNEIGNSLDAPAQAYVLAEYGKEILNIVQELEQENAVMKEKIHNSKRFHYQYPQCDLRLTKTIDKLIAAFLKSYVNDKGEFVVNPLLRPKFSLAECVTPLDVKCAVLESLSDQASCYIQILDGVNAFLGTDFSIREMDLIYTYLGDSIDHKRTIAFVESGYNIDVLTKETALENGTTSIEEPEL